MAERHPSGNPMVNTIRAAICHGTSYLRDLSSLDRRTIEANNACDTAHDFNLNWPTSDLAGKSRTTWLLYQAANLTIIFCCALSHVQYPML